MFFRREVVDVSCYRSSSQHLTVEITKVGDTPWLFSATYASPESAIRGYLWRELKHIKNNYRGPWLLAGDFNEATSMNERVGVGGNEMVR